MKNPVSDFKTTQIMQASEFEVYHYRETYFKALDFHSHDFYEIYLFLDGSVTYYIEDQIYHLVPGDLLLIPPGKMHRPVISDSTAVYERMVLWLQADYLCTLDDPAGTLQQRLDCFHGETGYRLRLEGETLSFARELLERLISLSDACAPLDRLRQRAGITLLLGELCQLDQPSFPEVPGRPSLVPEVIRYINAHYTGRLRLDDICGAFFVSKYHLSRKFKAYTHVTVYDYILSKRVAAACARIRQGDSVTAAAEKCGFPDYSNFYKTFTAKTGMTPAEFKGHCNFPGSIP